MIGFFSIISHANFLWNCNLEVNTIGLKSNWLFFIEGVFYWAIYVFDCGYEKDRNAKAFELFQVIWNSKALNFLQNPNMISLKYLLSAPVVLLHKKSLRILKHEHMLKKSHKINILRAFLLTSLVLMLSFKDLYVTKLELKFSNWNSGAKNYPKF